MQIYTKVQNTKSILISAAEIMTQFEIKGLEELNYLPPWLDEALASAIQVRGLKYLLKLVRENQL